MRRPVCLFVMLFTAAVWAAVLFSPPKPLIAEKAEGRYVTLVGTVEEKQYAIRDPGGEEYIQMTLGNVSLESEIPKEGAFKIRRGDKILCTIDEDPQTQKIWAVEGATVRVRGKIRLFRQPSNDGEFDAFLYYSVIGGYLFKLSNTHILAYNSGKDPVRSTLFLAREHLSAEMDEIYGSRHGTYGRECASVMKAMLLGESGLVDRKIKEKYQASGIVHVICVSGLHISLIGSGIYAFLRKCRTPVFISCIVTIAFLYLYGMLTGMHTSCIRALVMFGMRAAAKAAGRTYDTLTAMAIAALLLLIEQPCYLLYSGFLFSFTAIAAAGLMIPELPSPAKPLAIPLFTLPVHLSFYYTFPLYSVFLNMVVIFMAPILMTGGCISLILGTAARVLSGKIVLRAVFSGACGLAGEVPVLILWIFDRMCDLTQKLPFNTLMPGRPPNWVIAVYYILIAAAIAVSRLKSVRDRKLHVLRFSFCASAVFLIFTIRYTPPMALYMLDVGQGDGLVIRTCDENGSGVIVIDGGSSSRKGIGENVEIPFLKYHGIAKIDYCLLTHDDLDHCSGLLELLDQADSPGGIRIGCLGMPSIAEERKGETYLKIEKTAKLKGIPVTYLHRGMTYTKGKLNLNCLHPALNANYEDANEYSAVMLLTYDRFSAVLTGDLEGQGEKDLLDYLGGNKISADVMKIAHHGSKGGTTEEFLQKISSRLALISCGYGNRYGHPAPSTISRIMNAGMDIADTRKAGQISVTTDGRGGYSVHTFY